MHLETKKFGILGLGKSGIATAEFLTQLGCKPIAWDDNECARTKCASMCLINNEKSMWDSLDYVILSPGMPLHYPEPHRLLNQRVKTICDIELFRLLWPDVFCIAVSGTNGKSTTVALIHHILRYMSICSELVGNIGTPILSRAPPQSLGCVYVIEVSSYQLDLIDQARFNVSVLLNITPDHLDHHGNMERYTNAKMRIFKNQKPEDIAIRPDVTAQSDVKYQLPRALTGAHGRSNAFAAIQAVKHAPGFDESKLQSALLSFVGLKHRMQVVGQIDGITFVNDSKATNAEATKPALESFAGQRIYWIVGGVAKDGGISSLSKQFHSITHAFLIGASSDDFANVLAAHNVPFTHAGTLEAAFALSVSAAQENGGVVLLSPACSSFDQWRNFEERGDAFIELVSNAESQPAQACSRHSPSLCCPASDKPLVKDC